jgi:hypothetical protein
MNWREMLASLFAAPTAPPDRALPDSARYDLGVCPGCKGLRLATSPRCTHCGSAAPVTADA